MVSVYRYTALIEKVTKPAQLNIEQAMVMMKNQNRFMNKEKEPIDNVLLPLIKSKDSLKRPHLFHFCTSES